MHVLFVCTGNHCRSPFAERFATTYSTRMGLEDFRASSAGTRAMVGSPIHPDTARVLHEFGGDSTNFAGRQITQRIVSNADLIITMDRSHRDAVLELAPQQLRRTYTLGEIKGLADNFDIRSIDELPTLRAKINSGERLDIPDPIGEDIDYHRTICVQIADYLKATFRLFLSCS